MRILVGKHWKNATLEIIKAGEDSHQDVRVNLLVQGGRPVRVELTTEEAVALCDGVTDAIES